MQVGGCEVRLAGGLEGWLHWDHYGSGFDITPTNGARTASVHSDRSAGI